MKKTLFLVHDPGGYDVLYPIVLRFQKKSMPFAFYCLGPSGLINPLYAVDEQFMYESLIEMLNNDEINGLVTGTSWGNDCETEASKLAKQYKVPSIAVIDYWSNYALRFKTKVGSIYPDYCIIMDELSKAEAIADGIPANILQVLGHPGLDVYTREQSFNLQAIRHSQPFQLLFLSQPIEQVYQDSLGYTEATALQDCMQLVQLRPEITLKVKFHPKDNEQLIAHYVHLEVKGDLKAALEDIDLVIGMSTMGLLQAFLYGKQVISYQPNLKMKDACITNKLGLTDCVQSFEQLLATVDLLAAEASFPTRERAIPSHLLWGDGKSADRVFDFIKGVLAS